MIADLVMQYLEILGMIVSVMIMLWGLISRSTPIWLYGLTLVLGFCFASAL